MTTNNSINDSLSGGSITGTNVVTSTGTIVAASTGASYTMNLNNGDIFELTLTANATLSFSNVPASNGVFVTITLIQDGTGSRTVTWPTGTIWAGGTTPTLTTTANHVDEFILYSPNNGTTWRGFVLSQNYSS